MRTSPKVQLKADTRLVKRLLDIELGLSAIEVGFIEAIAVIVLDQQITLTPGARKLAGSLKDRLCGS